MRRRRLLVVVLVAVLAAVTAPTPARADATNTVAIVEKTFSKGSDVLTARIGIERNTDSTQGRFRLHLTCEWINPDTGKRSAQLCDFWFEFHTCWVHLTTLTDYCRIPEERFNDNDHTWVGVYRTLVRGHRYQVYSLSFRAYFHNSGRIGSPHDIFSNVYTH
jgi:hypothetical protein